jgi:hypothetical protein
VPEQELSQIASALTIALPAFDSKPYRRAISRVNDGLCGSYSSRPDRAITSGLPTTLELALLWFAFQRLANREQEDGTLVLCVR